MVGGYCCSLPSITCLITSRTAPLRQEKQIKGGRGYFPLHTHKTFQRPIPKQGLGGGVTWLISCHAPELHKAALLCDGMREFGYSLLEREESRLSPRMSHFGQGRHCLKSVFLWLYTNRHQGWTPDGGSRQT